MKYFFLFLILTTTAEAFTLNNNFAASFKKNRVKVYVAGDSTCTNINVTAADLQSYVKPAVDKFWNEVPTSRLRLKASGFSNPLATADINTARLCSPTDSQCITDAGTNGQTVLPPIDGIVISCNQLADNYDAPSVIAVTVPNNFSGKKIKGAVILINDVPGGKFEGLNRNDRIGVIAHEIGHAIGLGHSEDSQALMYYQVVDLRKSLGQDDIDGVTYLYPIKLDGCGLIDGLVASTVALKKNDDDDHPNDGGTPFWQMGIGFFFFLALAEILKLLKRQETRSAL
jgi:hypothetical protein